MTTLPESMMIPASELSARSKVRLEIVPDLPALCRHFARAVADEIEENNRHGRATRLILPVGPVDQYPILADICNAERISWRSVHVFNMDEYCDWQGRAVPADHPLSFRRAMTEFLWDRLDPALRIPAAQAHFPDPLALDTLSEAINAAGGVDTCYGGIGFHGHVAFNEPPISRWYRVTPDEFRNSLTRLVTLAPETVVMNSARACGGNTAYLPPMAVTIGMRDILQARRIRLYCPGDGWQRTALRIALLGQEDVAYPVTLLPGHRDYVIICDENTAAPPRPMTAA